jgi:hypothetical protein
VNDEKSNSAESVLLNPWDWVDLSFEEAEVHWDAYERSQRDIRGEVRSGVFVWVAVQRVSALRELIESNGKGAGFAVLECVRECGTNDLVMPAWLSHAFNRRYDAVSRFRALSWDDPVAFGKPYPKGTNQHAERQRLEKAISVWLSVNTAVKMGHKVDKALYASIGKELQIGATLAQEYYAHAKKHYGLFDPVAVKKHGKR